MKCKTEFEDIERPSGSQRCSGATRSGGARFGENVCQFQILDRELRIFLFFKSRTYGQNQFWRNGKISNCDDIFFSARGRETARKPNKSLRSRLS